MGIKWLTKSVLVAIGIALIGGILLGRDMVSYLHSSAKSVQVAVKDSVPIEFELKRARDLLEDIIPEMHANIRLIAQEEVEIASLKADIAESEESIDEEKVRIAKLRDALIQPQVQYTYGGREYSRSSVKDDLARRFERFKESELVLTSKQRLLNTRENSLNAAIELLEKTRSNKLLLEDKIEVLASQYRLVKAASVGSKIQVDNSKMAKTEKLITQIQKRLDVAERVLSHESQFVQEIDVDAVVEEDLLTQVDDYFREKETQSQFVSAIE
ncbi:signal peptide-containing protein [Planctomycetota bacterium]